MHYAICIKCGEGADDYEAKSENLPVNRVLLSSDSKKDMFRGYDLSGIY